MTPDGESLSAGAAFSGAAARRRGGHTGTALPAPAPRRSFRILVVLVVTLLFVPAEGSVFLGDLRLPPERIILLAITPLTLMRFLRSTAARDYRFVWSDLFMPLSGLWMVASVCVTEGAARGFIGAGVIALEWVGGYFATRVLLTAQGHEALRLATLLALLISAIGLLSVPDMFAGHYIFHDLVGAVTGHTFNYIYDVRGGHIRAAGPMEHPILLGVISMIGILLAVSRLRGGTRLLAFAGCGAGLVSAVSSAPISGVFLGFGCLLYKKLTPGLASRWRFLMLACGAGLLALFSATSSPFGWLIGHMTFDPGTGYYRLLVWQIAGGDLVTSPLFGLGMSDDWARPSWMPSTVDSVWLRSAMSFGEPGSLLIAASMISACAVRMDMAGTSLSPAERHLGMVLSIILALCIYLGFTVHFWGITWTLLAMLCGMRAHLGARAKLGPTNSAGR